jgi:transposase
MLTVETIGRIRREHFLKGKTIKEIVRDLRVSRNTVRKVLRSGETSFAYERTIQPRPKLGRWTAELDDLLSGNAAKPSREQLTLIRIFEELRGRGYDGGYDTVRRYARRWSKAHGQSTAVAYVPLSFAPGEAYQFDWSHEVILLSGVTVTVKVAHVRLCHSRMPFVRAYPRETQEMVFDAHDRAFAFFRGGCRRGIYDNMKTAVETVFVGKERLYNGAPFKHWVLPAAMERVRRKLASADDGNRQMVNILSAVLADGLPAVEAACAEALEHGVHSADVILNILARQRDRGVQATILTPAALTLNQPPVADATVNAEYDVDRIRSELGDLEHLGGACRINPPQSRARRDPFKLHPRAILSRPLS